MPFIDVKAEGHIEHVSDNEEEAMKDKRSSYRACIHGSILNVLITLWTLK